MENARVINTKLRKLEKFRLVAVFALPVSLLPLTGIHGLTQWIFQAQLWVYEAKTYVPILNEIVSKSNTFNKFSLEIFHFLIQIDIFFHTMNK